MKTLRERLLEFIEEERISARAFERECGLTNGYVTNLVSAGSEKLVLIHRAFPKLSIDWLLFEEGEMYRSESSTNVAEKQQSRVNSAPSFQNNGNACTNNQSNIPVEVLLNTQSHLTESQKQNSELIRIVAHLTQSN